MLPALKNFSEPGKAMAVLAEAPDERFHWPMPEGELRVDSQELNQEPPLHTTDSPLPSDTDGAQHSA
jgi:hypothetical protein